jgi:hypothetical protein
MMPVSAIAVVLGLNVIFGATPLLAGQQIYVYSVTHPFYGEIGTRTDTIDRSPEGMRIDSHLRIAVRLVGIVVYRQESNTTEIIRGNRLLHFEMPAVFLSDTLQHGKAQDGQVVVHATSGSFSGPATIAPCEPWVLKHTGAGTLVYPSTGRIMNAQVFGGEYETVSPNGATVSARHFTVVAHNRDDVWLDDQGIPVMFRAIENGTPIDFVLQTAPQPASVSLVTPGRPTALAGSDHGNK